MSDYKKQRNKRIAELQKKNKEISEANKNNSAQILALIIKNGLLEKQNKELQEQIEKMKNCKNCSKYLIEGACGHFTQVGICKNWEIAE